MSAARARALRLCVRWQSAAECHEAPLPTQAGPSGRFAFHGVAMLDLDHVQDHDLIITTTDFARLQSVIDTHNSQASELLDYELRRARIVEPEVVPADVVTMNSTVVYEDCDTGARREIRVCYPQDADATAGKVSVLAPIGSALLGLRVGQVITWPVPNGTKRVRVAEVR